MSNPYQQPGPYGSDGQPQQPPYQQPGYGYGYPQQPPYGGPPVPQQNNAATASVVLGFIAILTTCWFGGLLGIVGLVVGFVGLNRSGSTGTGRSTAIGGIVLNGLALLITVALLVGGIALYQSHS